MTDRLSAPPIGAQADDFVWKDWFRQLKDFLNDVAYRAYAGDADADAAGSASISINLPPTDVLVDGQVYSWRAATNNGGGAYTLDVNSLGAQPVTDNTGANPVAGAIQANSIVSVVWNDAQSRFELL